MSTDTRAPLWQLDACDLGAAYRAGALTPLAVLDAHLERLNMVQPAINAMAWVDAEGARHAASASTERLRQGQPLSALDGVPVTVKDNIPLAGLPCRWGSRLWQDHRPAVDESPVARLRAAGAPVVFIQHESTAGYLEHGTREWQLADGLQVQPGDLRVRKKTPDAFLNTDLEALLKARGVEEVIVCGMHTEFCVDTTTRRALALGYPVTLVADAHTSAGNEVLGAPQVIAHHNATLTNISSFGPRVRAVNSADVGLNPAW